MNAMMASMIVRAGYGHIIAGATARVAPTATTSPEIAVVIARVAPTNDPAGL
jgi:hypothetical protein